jgi:cellulose synthase/poly-beta-1,6-N-acetylglucosamine synthase-like glycosyltransferase
MKIDFAASFKDLFSTEKKWMTVLGLSVSMLIPLVGPVVAIGYLMRRFARVRNGKSAEDFDFNNFGEYLQIGLWPILCSIVATVVLMPIIFICALPMSIGPMIAQDNEGLGIALIIVGSILYLVAIFLLMMVTYPVMLRAGLTMDFKSGFSKSFIISFTKKVGMSLIGYLLLVSIIAVPLMLIGYLALLVGAIVVAAGLQFVMLHLIFQHYDLYLERGGEAIVVNPELIKDYGAPPLPNTNTPPPADQSGAID